MKWALNKHLVWDCAQAEILKPITGASEYYRWPRIGYPEENRNVRPHCMPKHSTKNMKEAGYLVLPHTYWDHLFGLCRNWTALVNSIGLSKQVVTPITAAVPDFVSFIEQINIALAHGMQLMSWQCCFLCVI